MSRICGRRRSEAMSPNYKPNEMMTIAAARALKNNDVTFVGIGMPSAAANLARLTHAPEHHAHLRVRHARDQAERAAALDRRRRILRDRADHGRRCRKCSATGCKAAASPSAFSAARRSTNTPISTPRWSAPMTSRRCGCRAAAARPRSRPRAARFSSSWRKASAASSDKLDFITSLGHGEGGDHRERLGVKTKGPTKLVTDLVHLRARSQDRGK